MQHCLAAQQKIMGICHHPRFPWRATHISRSLGGAIIGSGESDTLADTLTDTLADTLTDTPGLHQPGQAEATHPAGRRGGGGHSRCPVRWRNRWCVIGYRPPPAALKPWIPARHVGSIGSICGLCENQWLVFGSVNVSVDHVDLRLRPVSERRFVHHSVNIQVMKSGARSKGQCRDNV